MENMQEQYQENKLRSQLDIILRDNCSTCFQFVMMSLTLETLHH